HVEHGLVYVAEVIGVVGGIGIVGRRNVSRYGGGVVVGGALLHHAGEVPLQHDHDGASGLSAFGHKQLPIIEVGVHGAIGLHVLIFVVAGGGLQYLVVHESGYHAPAAGVVDVVGGVLAGR